MERYTKIVQYAKKVKDNLNLNGAKELLRKTAIETYIITALSLGAGFTTSYYYEFDKSRYIPLSFSEKTQIERDSKYKEQKVGHITKYLTSVNDICMKVFECYNMSNDPFFKNQERHKLAFELDIKIDPALKVHTYQISDLTKDILEESVQTRQQLEELVQIKDEISKVDNFFRGSFDANHNNVYYPHLVTTYDDEGNAHTNFELKYDHTTHTYKYHRDYGEKASKSIDELLISHKNPGLNETIITSSKTNAEGELASEQSRKKELKGKRFGAQKLQEISDKWSRNAGIIIEFNRFVKSYNNMQGDALAWRGAKQSAHSDQYNTGSSYDSGPSEYQVVVQTLGDLNSVHSAISNMIYTIDYTKKKTPLLEAKIREFISVELDKKNGNSKRLKGEILSLAKDIYRTNFPSDYEVKDFNVGVVMLFTLLCGGLGGFAGYKLNQMSDNYLRKKEGSQTVKQEA